MDNYFFTTLIKGITKLAPYVAFIVGGYLVFIKLPFLFLRKSMDEQKKKLSEENKDLKVVQEKYTVEDYQKFKDQMKTLNFNQKEKPKTERPRAEQKFEQKKEQKKTEQPKRPAKPTLNEPSPEEIFQFKAHEAFTQSDLKKRYFELLKQNHPDRVASMGEDFKKLAEKNTKDINKAYEALKKKAS